MPISPDAYRRFPVGSGIRALAQDRSGFLWLGTSRGVLRFDGDRFMPTGDLPAVRALAALHDGGVLSATAGGLHVLQGHRWVEDEALSLVTGKDVTSLLVDGRGALWVASARGVTKREPGRAARAVFGIEGPVRALAAFRGQIWAANSGGIYRLHGESFERVRDQTGVVSLAVEEGIVWFGTDSTPWLHVLENGRVLDPPEVVQEGFNGPAVQMAVEPTGGVRLAAASGLHIARRDGIVRLQPSALSANLEALSFLRDKDGNTWIGTALDGLVMLEAQPEVLNVGELEGLGTMTPFSVAQDSSGALWSVVTDGLVRIEGGRVNTVFVPAADRTWNYRSLSIARDGAIWVGTLSSGVVRQQQGRFRRWTTRDGLPSDAVSALHHDRAGVLWTSLGTGGLARFTADRFEEVPGSRQGCPGVATAFADGAQEELWIATASAGLCRYAAGTFTRFTTAEGLPENNLRALFADAQGPLWIGTDSRGLCALRSERIECLSADANWRVTGISGIVADTADNLWLAADDGLWRVPRRDLIDVLEGRRKRPRVLRLGIEDGLRATTFLAQYPPAAIMARDGGLWFPSVRGLAHIPDPASAGVSAIPAVQVDRILVNGTAVVPEPATALGPWPVGGGNLDIEFTAPALEDSHRLRFAYRLQGFDGRWHDAGDRRRVTYTNLPAGSYTFLVRVGSDDRDDHAETSLVLALQAPLHRTKSFYAACVALAMGLGFAGYRVRVVRLRDRYRAIMAERTRIARDLHDTLEQSLVAVKLQLEAVTEDPRYAGASGEHIARARDLCAQSLRDARNSIWALREGQSEDLDLATMFAVMAGRVLRGTQVRFEVRVTGKPYRLEPEAQQQVLRIVAEALTNALKHARSTTVTLRLNFTDQDLELALADDGVGFLVDDRPGPDGGHFGLLGMSERAQMLGAEVSVRSSPQRGSVVSIVIPARWRRREG